MKEDVCRVCGGISGSLFESTVLNKYAVTYYRCTSCEFIQTENPYWLEEAYNDSINLIDTGLSRRNIIASKSVSTLLFFLFDVKARYLDYAGGYGMFTRLMRDIGFDFYTYDPFTPNLLAKGFDYNQNDRIEVLTTFESFEHFAEPLVQIEKMLGITKNVLFSTQLIPTPVPTLHQWWYYAPEHGQHIAFYSKKTLKFIAHKYRLNVYSLKGFHLFTERKIPLIYFKLLIGLGYLGLYKIAHLFLKSKTELDRQALSNKASYNSNNGRGV